MSNPHSHMINKLTYDLHGTTHTLTDTTSHHSCARVIRFGHTQNIWARRFYASHPLSTRLFATSPGTQQHGPATRRPLHAPNGAAAARSGKPLRTTHLKWCVAQPTTILHNVRPSPIRADIGMACNRCVVMSGVFCRASATRRRSRTNSTRRRCRRCAW